ncbi:MAG: DUF1559 domain-containing protein, partial [Planctomycetota bacterium]
FSGGFVVPGTSSWPPDLSPKGLTHYRGISGIWGSVSPGLDYFFSDGSQVDIEESLMGVFHRRSKTELRRVTDGTSQTLMFGEAPGANGLNVNVTFSESSGGSVEGDFNGFAQGVAWAGWATLYTEKGLDLSFENRLGRNHDTHRNYYGSMHSGGIVQFCMVDGSVQVLNRDIEKEVFLFLSTMQGEEVIPGELF